MPYIKKKDRVDPHLEHSITTLNNIISSQGDLNYVLTRLCHGYIKDNGLNYSSINNTIGVLECCKLELYRRIAAPYEDKKIEENGDVNEVS